MLHRAMADLVMGVHLAFVGFVVLGGLLVWRWPRSAWLHAPAAAWGIAIEWGRLPCPLTPLEQSLRRRGGEAGFAGGFIDHYLASALYPEGLTRGMEIGLGAATLGLNILLYGIGFARRRRRGATRRA